MAIGQGQILVTPLQMARFYAMIANGGKLVTPHIAEDVEQTGRRPAQPARVLRRFGAQPPTPTGVDPTALAFVQQGLDEATHVADRHLVRRLRQLPGRRSPARRARAEKLVDAAGLPVPART